VRSDLIGSWKPWQRRLVRISVGAAIISAAYFATHATLVQGLVWWAAGTLFEIVGDVLEER